MIRKFLKDETAATMIEYGLIAAGIAIVVIAGVRLVGTNLLTMFNNIAGDLN
jgi:pilus assembly protein Flp/PilA